MYCLFHSSFKPLVFYSQYLRILCDGMVGAVGVYVLRSRSSLTQSRDDVTLRKAAETAESFVTVKAFIIL